MPCVDVLGQQTGRHFKRGDSNVDGAFDISDPIQMLGFLFTGTPAELACRDAADSNDSGTVDISDALFSLNFLFSNTAQPPAPYPDCGADPTDDQLGCMRYDPCLQPPPPPGSPLPGAPTDPVAMAIPDQIFIPDEARFDPDMDRSVDTFGLGFAPGVTVAEANRLLVELDAEIVGGYGGVAGEAGGLLVVRVPTESLAELKAVVARVRQSPAVAVAVIDHWLRPTLRPPDRPDLKAECEVVDSVNWSYTGTGFGATWGLELLRAPQMWNIVEALEKRGTDPVGVGVIDAGFEPHVDLPYSWDGSEDDHGTSVAGVIGARWNDGVGTDGVSPFVRFELRNGRSFLSTYTELFIDLADRVEVVNLSMSYRYFVDRDDGLTALRLMAAYQARNGRIPIIVVAAGNDSDLENGERAPARDGSGASWAATLGAANIASIEALQSAGDPASLANFSNVGGHLSAAGDFVGCPMGTDHYCRRSGTSFAAPLVTGLIAFLMAAEPELVTTYATVLGESPALDLLRATARPIGEGTSPAADGFAALMELDRLTGSRRILRMLVDIDDGTPDGNTRIRGGAVILDEDEDGDGGRGDGDIDMSDFRRLRDWMFDDLATLDGDESHPKRDQNFDGENEGVSRDRFSRGDFNGDGRLSDVRRAYVPGSIDREVTDLEVLMEVFEDPLYEKDELPGLLASGDVTIDLGPCFSQPGAAEATVRVVQPVSGNTVKIASFRPDGSGNRHVLTIPLGFYTVEVRTLDGAGAALGEADHDVQLLGRGEDVFLSPDCPDVAPPPAGFLYRAEILDRDGGFDTAGASDINDAGQVLGRNAAGYWIYTPGAGSMQLPNVGRPYYLGDAGAFEYPDIPPPPGATTVSWDAISDRGVFAGAAPGGPAVKKAYVYAGSTFEILADFTEITGDWSISDVNDSLTVVGRARAFAADLSGATPVELALPPGAASSHASLVNNAGWIAGNVTVTGEGVFPALWRGGDARVYRNHGIEQIHVMNDTGTLIATCPTVGCWRISYDAETFSDLPLTYEVDVDAEGTEVDYRVGGVGGIIDINDSGVILATGAPPGGGAGRVLLLTPAGSSRLDVKVQAVPSRTRPTVRYLVTVRNTGLDGLSELHLTVNLSHPARSRIPLPPECVPNRVGEDGVFDTVICTWPESQSLAPDESLLVTFDFAPIDSGTFRVDFLASMLSATDEPAEDTFVVRTPIP